MHFAGFEKFTSAYLFQITWEKSCDYLLIICNTKNITKTTNFDSACIFSSFNWLAETDYYLCQIQIQDQHFQNHSAKNLEMCKDWFYMVTSLVCTCFTVYKFALTLQKNCTPFSANQNWVIFSCILLLW